MKQGDWPLRRRGYYRALKRKESWAVELSKRTGLAWWFAWTYTRFMTDSLFNSRSVLLDSVQKDNKWTGSTWSAPIKFYKNKKP